MTMLDFPELRQSYEYDCGAKALQSVLAYYGVYVREELILKQAKSNERDGTSIDGLCRVVTQHKLQYASHSMTLAECQKYIDQKIPIIILLQAWSYEKTTYTTSNDNGHWVVLIGHDSENVYFEDPYSFYRTYLTHAEFEDRWHGQEDGKTISHHGITVFGKEPSFDPRRIIHMN